MTADKNQDIPRNKLYRTLFVRRSDKHEKKRKEERDKPYIHTEDDNHDNKGSKASKADLLFPRKGFTAHVLKIRVKGHPITAQDHIKDSGNKDVCCRNAVKDRNRNTRHMEGSREVFYDDSRQGNGGMPSHQQPPRWP